MVRYLLAVAGVVMLISGSAFAETGDMGDMGTKKVITRTSPDGMAQKKVIIKRHGDGLVSKKIIRHEGLRHEGFRHEGYGSSMSRTRTFEPGAGGVTVKRRTVIRD